MNLPCGYDCAHAEPHGTHHPKVGFPEIANKSLLLLLLSFIIQLLLLSPLQLFPKQCLLSQEDQIADLFIIIDVELIRL